MPIPTVNTGVPFPKGALQLTAGATSTSTLLAGVERISMLAVGGPIRYEIGVGSQTALTTSHYIGEGERLDISLLSDQYLHIAVMRAGASDATLEITKLY